MSGTVVGLVPIRGFHSGKTRLADAMSPEARTAVSQLMLRGVVQAVLAVEDLDCVAVISPDSSALAFSRAIDDRVVPIQQRKEVPGLNTAVTIGRDWAVERGASGLLVAFSDLPLLSSVDLQIVLEHPAQVVIATDRHGSGTNISLVRFEGLGAQFKYQYGPGSANRHEHEAGRCGLSFGRVSTLGAGFDLDTPTDWEMLLSGDRDLGGLAELRRDPVVAAAGMAPGRERS